MIQAVASANNTVVIPTFSQLSQAYHDATLSCISSGPQCLLPGMDPSLAMTNSGTSLVVTIIAVVLIATVIPHILLYKKYHAKQKDRQEVISETLAIEQNDLAKTEQLITAIAEHSETNKAVKPKQSFKPQPPKVSKEAAPEKNKKNNSDISGLGEDVLATKLNLARVYIEMGSEQEARKLLESVIKSGDETQKLTAEKLMKKITEKG